MSIMGMQEWREEETRRKVIRAYEREYGKETFKNIMAQMNTLRDMGVNLHRVVDEIGADNSAYMAGLNKEQLMALRGFFTMINN
jgi:hypothetical protein